MKKEYEVIVTSSHSSKVNRYKVKAWQLKLVLYSLILFFLGLAAGIVFYGRVYVTALKVNRLEAENRRLKKENMKITELEEKIQQMEILREKLYAMLGYDKAPKIKPYLHEKNTTEQQGESEKSLPFTREKNYDKNPYGFSLGMQELLEYVLKEDSITPRGMPVKGFITRGYGPIHKAIDIGAPVGTPVMVTAYGIVDSVFYDMRLGEVVLVKHNNEYETLYGHLQSIRVYPGKNVVRGEVIGEVGLSGFTTGPHLHYEVRNKTGFLNPMYFLND